MSVYIVEIGSHSTRIRMSKDTIIEAGTSISDPIKAEDYDGHYHNKHGVYGAVIDRAVRKIFGKSCTWFGNHDNRLLGQVVRSGGSTATPQVYINIKEV